MQNLKPALLAMALAAVASSGAANFELGKNGGTSFIDPPMNVDLDGSEETSNIRRLGFRNDFHEMFSKTELDTLVKRVRRVSPLDKGFDEIDYDGIGAFLNERPRFTGPPMDMYRVGIKTHWPLDMDNRRDLMDGGSNNVNLGDKGGEGVVPEPGSIAALAIGLGALVARRFRPTSTAD
ncbi:MAG: hypothetical protein HONBIEJF_00063 [Fimbriimonadaceae bacterium]|nr:hypothetical protein [Fimbriimonadaceae bacterium]